ncbi:anthrone oxygenase family protein [Kitasatospora sp. NBC_00315]|uniref:anthrone oxygenase family protein n=1 Tax=Kitasatospora sp. NBC_00315 TaxID=2975963 RepID=UPI003244D717
MHILEVLNLLSAGLLAGAEFVVRFGVRSSIGALDPEPSILLRQALIRRLRRVVPALYLPTLLTGLAVTIRYGGGTGLAVRCAAMAAVLVWTVTTFAGTVPINATILDEWRADAPPAGWRATVRRWERLDTIRTVAAMVAFVLFLIAADLRLP